MTTWVQQMSSASGMELVLSAALIVVLGRMLLLLWRPNTVARRRVLAEDALKHIHHSELRGHLATSDSLAGALRISPSKAFRLIAQLEGQNWLRTSAGGLSLTTEGSRLAIQVIRAHRLWERYLVDEARMPLGRVHAEAERLEHARSDEALDVLDAAMGHPAVDPHGDPIPTADGKLASLPARAITDWPLKKPARIVHVEDEPAAVFAQIVAQGLEPGKTIWVVEADAKRLVLSDGADVFTLAPVVGANIFVEPADETRRQRALMPRLWSLRAGTEARVVGLAEPLQGYTRRRLLDLGLTPGVVVRAGARGLFGDPVAYHVRGSLIALRRDQAEHVLISPIGNGAAENG